MRASSWLYQYSSQSKFTYGVCPALPGAGPQQQQPQLQAPPQHQHPSALGYGPEVVVADYNNGRPYGLGPPLPPGQHEHELGPPYQPGHGIDDGQLAAWAKDRPLVKQEPAEVFAHYARARAHPRREFAATFAGILIGLMTIVGVKLAVRSVLDSQ